MDLYVYYPAVFDAVAGACREIVAFAIDVAVAKVLFNNGTVIKFAKVGIFDNNASFEERAEKGEHSVAVLRFLYWCLLHGDELVRGTGFAPLPIILQSKLAARLAAVKPVDGKLPHYQGA